MFLFVALSEARSRHHSYPKPRPYQPYKPHNKLRCQIKPTGNAYWSPDLIKRNYSDYTYKPLQVHIMKPAIYLYPTKEMDLTVGVSMERENFTTVVPEFTAGTYWNVTAKPNGDLIHNNKVIPYLYWEGDISMRMKFDKGFFVKKGEGREFLEKILTQFKLNDREKFDFITYWLPTFNKLGNVFCSFQLANYCHHVPLTCSAKPDSVIRVYIAIRKARKSDLNKPVQAIPNIKRTGFTIVEWGGSIIRSRHQRLSRAQ
ncbi:hypothetical protein TVAG_219200 [Trichomonas vaginalis G3]|uniref:Uncharacterized protein n=1 Tax=Trichomonas vaginalis (strain ATCC PRA-98 / G3) TaxID=412133 RepID=A2FKQ2_TRIV3|nr:hypothetical protein TVAGG3_0866910 [Trichomonas vaginalis G3]EAX94514.1 hypothetical protein TVAG_219200 [Trichomonas vaginalis G3]KAI5501096.1 hypothetical protein TVAGG3_0866910 [Trichomonas vaginalis G3]|eukprot:XP_001307444.1 hypothetical protein [Trichomonas vaginalis G3]